VMARHRRSTKTLFRQGPLPYMLILIAWAARTFMRAVEVNWLSWDVLKVPDLQCVAIASSTASMQKLASSVIDTL
jgi:hypothetical protein